MKYTNTSKTLAMVFHAILFLAFGAMGIYFGAFVVPGYFNTNIVYTGFRENLALISNSYMMYFELAVIGIVLAAMSCIGFLKAYKSLNAGDKEVVDSFAAFIAEGWFLAIAFILNGAVFFGMISGTSNVWFTVIIAIVFAIIALIATNIPMVKLFDGKDSKPLIANLSYAGAITGGVIAVESILSIVFFNWNALAYKSKIFIQLALIAILGIAICVACAVVAANGKKEGKTNALDGALIGAASFITGAIFAVLGVLAYVWKDAPVHLVFNPAGSLLTGAWNDKWGMAFVIMMVVVGVAIAGAGTAVIVLGGNKGKKAAK
ncbi:MAG: hypothetical protein MJ220_03485 [Bacilli bacterium]|nr:hypothetical protein [Bacilli bacterium]